MISDTIMQSITKFVPRENLYIKEPMDKHTTFRVGGPADCLIELEDSEQVQNLLRYLNQLDIPFFVLGKGSNLLVSDGGYEGIVLHIGPKMNKIRVVGNKIVAKAGALMSKVARTAYENGLTGLEFAAGIPGTIGGGVVMNAGAYGGELKQVVSQVTVINKDGNLLELNNETMEFGYRTSVVKNRPLIVTEVALELSKGEPEEIKAKMEDLAQKRRDKQPLEYASAGSTFKRPEGHFAGELIMNAGMKGFQIGDARVSEKHCGFIVNTGNATGQDIYTVMTEVRKCVKDKFHVDLEPEVVMLGKF
ncbi:UDP-N-acetylmuramate dehydrogenase [Lachnospiraceae bacterium OttesenSCG-928-D06]|nr:UDP-N-acetylmuramate dehydrogenase [Lachnospiraceae bacterium OttesenSCG-928-D06]